MTLQTLITVNAILGAVVVYGIVQLLAHGIHSDLRARLGDLNALRPRAARERDRLAA
jgi:hypothetical protein